MRKATANEVRQHVIIAELRARIAALEAMLRAAGYSEKQIKAGTPYVELMGI